MKKVHFIVALAFLSMACNNLKDNEFKVVGEAKGVENGTKVFVEIQSEMGVTTKDTAEVKDGKFELKGTFKEMDLGFIRFETDKNNKTINLPIIIENGVIEITVDKEAPQNSILGGTNQNEKFNTFNKGSKTIADKVTAFEKKNQEVIQKAQMVNDTVTINRLMKEYKAFQDEMNAYSKKFVNENNDAYLSVLLLENFAIRKYLPSEEIKKIYESLDKALQNTKSAKNIKQILDKELKTDNGSVAPNFTAPTPDGKKITLNDVKGKVTIIDFWASWCGPCRAENPNVVALYNELHDKGLNIIGVSLDENDSKWKEAIAKDGLSWPQVSNLKHWQDPIAKQYDVQSIPATFILDEKGKIVAKNLRGEALRTKVLELLNAK